MTSNERASTRSWHDWSEEDYRKAFCLFKYPPSDSRTYGDVAQEIGCTLASLMMAISNFRSLAGLTGLPHFSRLQKQVFDHLNSMPEPEVMRLAHR